MNHPTKPLDTPIQATGLLAAALLAAMATSASPARAQTPITPTILGDLGSMPVFPHPEVQQRGTDPGVGRRVLNDAGQIVASGNDGAGVTRAMVWDPASPTFPAPIVLGDGGQGAQPYAINARGQIIGFVSNGGPVVWEQTGPGTWGPPIPLGNLGSSAIAHAINAAGVIVGRAYEPGIAERAVVWQPTGAGTWAAPVALDDLGYGAAALGLTPLGAIVGSGVDGSNRQHALWWSAAAHMLTPLIDPGTDLNHGVLGLNDAGQVIAGITLGGIERGVLWDPSSPSFPNAIVLGDLGEYTLPLGINAAGNIVGRAYDTSAPSPYGRAVLWDAAHPTDPPQRLPGVYDLIAYDINDANVSIGGSGQGYAVAWTGSGLAATLLPADGNVYVEAEAINGSGLVVGYTYIGGNAPHALMWTLPRPLPTLTRLTPATASVGTAGLTVTVSGTGFTPQSIVLINGAARQTRFVLGTQLAADLTAADLATVGNRSITVTTPAPGGGTSNALTLRVAAAPRSLVVQNVNDAGTGSLRDAIIAANAAPGSTITFALPSPSTINLADPLPDISESVTITGPGAAALTVRRNSGGDYRLLTVGEGVAINLTGVTLENGAGVGFGGAMSVAYGATLVATEVVLAGSGRNTIYGGGLVALDGSTVTLRHCTFRDNGQAAGGPYSGSALYVASATVRLEDTIIVGTTNGAATVANIGTLTLSRSSVAVAGPTGMLITNEGALTIVNSTLSGGGVGVYVASTNADTRVDLLDATIAGQTDAGVYADTRFSMFAHNSIIAGPAPSCVCPVAGAAATITSLGHNIDANGTCNLTAVGDLPNVGAELAPLGLYGGTSSSFALRVASPAIGAGDPVACAAVGLVDQRGAPRDPLACDIGAFESQGFMLTASGPASQDARVGMLLPALIGARLTANDPGVPVDGEAITVTAPAQGPSLLPPNTSLATDRTGAAELQPYVNTIAGTFAVSFSAPAVVPVTRDVTSSEPPPTLTSLTPETAVIGAAEQRVEVVGMGFTPQAEAYVDGASRTTIVGNTTALTVVLPATDFDAAGTLSITVVTPGPLGGTSNALPFTVTEPPSPILRNLMPRDVLAGSPALVLRLTGVGFTTRSFVTMRGSPRDTRFMTATELEADIPATDLTVGMPLAMRVVTPGPGGGTSNLISLIVSSPAPTLATLSPSTIAPGLEQAFITVTGTGFTPNSRVRLGADKWAPAAWTSSTVLVAVPFPQDVATAGPRMVAVVTDGPGGGESESLVLLVENPAPTLTELSPSQVVAGSASVVITAAGTGFAPQSVARINGVDDIPTVYESDTNISVSVPAEYLTRAGAVSIRVFNPAPGGGTSDALVFTVTAAPTGGTGGPDDSSGCSALGGEPSALTVLGVALAVMMRRRRRARP